MPDKTAKNTAKFKQGFVYGWKNVMSETQVKAQINSLIMMWEKTGVLDHLYKALNLKCLLKRQKFRRLLS